MKTKYNNTSVVTSLLLFPMILYKLNFTFLEII